MLICKLWRHLVFIFTTVVLFGCGAEGRDGQLKNSFEINEGSELNVSYMSLDTANDRVWMVVDKGIVLLQLDSNKASLLPVEDTHRGIAALEWSDSDNRLLLAESIGTAFPTYALTSFDPFSGVLGRLQRGLGSPFFIGAPIIGNGVGVPSLMHIDLLSDEVLLAGMYSSDLKSIDLSNGTGQTIKANDDAFAGPLINEFFSATFDALNNRVIALAQIQKNGSNIRALVSVDLQNGKRERINVVRRESGLVLDDATWMVLDNDRALIISGVDAALYEVNLTDGMSSELSGQNVGQGIAMIYPTQFVLDSKRNRVIVFDRRINALIEIDLSTGNRQRISSPM